MQATPAAVPVLATGARVPACRLPRAELVTVGLALQHRPACRAPQPATRTDYPPRGGGGVERGGLGGVVRLESESGGTGPALATVDAYTGMDL